MTALLLRRLTLPLLLAGTALAAQEPSPMTAPAATDRQATVATSAGAVQGSVEGRLHVFRGIPYAQAGRWQAPQPVPAWPGVRQATAFGPACFQPASKLNNIYANPPWPMSEDCLSLNIWAPADAKNAPVFFWIYGGALWSGTARDPMYDGRKLAEKGVVVVSINYRVGVLGWLAHPELSAASPDGRSGNYGLMDQVAALKWVKANIGAFGGDPANVTIAGESAGGLSAMYLLASPPARGLFAKAIAQSAYMISTPLLKTAAYGAPSAEEAGAALGHKIAAPSIAALRAMDPAALTDAAQAAGFAPFGAVDGHWLPDQLATVFDKGQQAPVPILAGFNSGEIRSLRVIAPAPAASADAYAAAIHASYHDLADYFLKLYPPADQEQSILATTRDALYGWTAERLARKQRAIGQPAYLYLWDHGYPAADRAELHGFHASELPFVFGTTSGTPPLWPKVPDAPGQAAMSAAMIDYWTSFARTGHPTAAGAPAWPMFDAKRSYMHFADTPRPSVELMPGMYDLNEGVVCRRRAARTQAWNWNVGLWSPPLPPKATGCS